MAVEEADAIDDGDEFAGYAVGAAARGDRNSSGGPTNRSLAASTVAVYHGRIAFAHRFPPAQSVFIVGNTAD
jgi:hypothetical protein